MSWWRLTEPFFCCVCVRTRDRQRKIFEGSVAVHSQPGPAEPFQSSDRLLAGRLARESRNSWTVEGKERESQGSAGQFPGSGLWRPQRRGSKGGRLVKRPRTAALMSSCLHVDLQSLSVTLHIIKKETRNSEMKLSSLSTRSLIKIKATIVKTFMLTMN